MSEGTSECRHEANGNALCSFRLPTEADRDYQSRPYELNPKRADGILFKMFYFCKSKDGRDWADPIAELGVVVSEFAGWKTADCQLRVRVVGHFRHFRFARGPHQRWKFRVPRRVLEDAQADCGPLRAEFAIELDDRERVHWPPKRGRPSNASGRSSPHSDRVSPERSRRRRNSAGDRSTGSAASFAPSDPNGSTFFLHLQDIHEREFKQPRQSFENVEFLVRFFPPDRRGFTSNFEFFLFHFYDCDHVRLTLDWALKNWRNEMDFHEQSQYTFHRCVCRPNSKCKHRKTYFRVPSDELERFADGRGVTLVLKLRSEGRGPRSVSPRPRSDALEGSESPVPPAGFANPYIDYGVLDGSSHGEQSPAASGGSAVELQPTDAPHFVPPPIPLTVQPKANGALPVGAYVNAINEMLTRATGAGPSASVPPPAAAVSPAAPTIRVKEEPADEETSEKENPAPSAPTVKLNIPPPTTARRPVVARPVQATRNTQESREKEIVPTPPPTETPPLAKETHPPNATETVRIKQEPQVDEQPQVELPKEPADVEEESDESDDDDDESDDESSSEEEPEIEEVTARKRRLDPPGGGRSSRTPTKRPRQVEKEEKAEETLPNPKLLNKQLLAVVVEGKQFEVERNVLIEESAFFAKKVAKQESLVDCLPAEITGDTMAAVVYWMETKQVDDLDKKAHALYVAAKLLGMPDLQKTCVESIKRTCRQRKATAGVVFAVQHENADLLSAMGFVWKRAKRMRKVLKSKEFGQLLKQRPELIHKVLDAM